jgi:diguanylate cyclase
MHSGEAFFLAIFGLASLPLGFALGWLTRLQSAGRADRSSFETSTRTGRPSIDSDVLLKHASAAFRSFCDVTDGLHRDVDMHGARLAAATTSLNQDRDVECVVARIVEANAWLQDQLVTAQKTIRQQAVELERRMVEANSDGLTNIANRRAFDMELQRHLARWQRHGSVFTLIMLDIDHFKNVNDRYGHLAGDAVLRATAELIKDNIREVDFVARFGGEEFAIILCEADHHSALLIADRIRKTISTAEVPWEGNALSVTVSVGVAALSRFDDVETLIKRADEAMYIAKREGRNRTALASHTPQPNELKRQTDAADRQPVTSPAEKESEHQLVVSEL